MRWKRKWLPKNRLAGWMAYFHLSSSPSSKLGPIFLTCVILYHITPHSVAAIQKKGEAEPPISTFGDVTYKVSSNEHKQSVNSLKTEKDGISQKMALLNTFANTNDDSFRLLGTKQHSTNAIKTTKLELLGSKSSQQSTFRKRIKRSVFRIPEGDAGGDSGRSSGSNRVSTAVSSGNSGVRDHSERPRNAPGLILNDGTSPHSPFLVQEENSTSNNFSGADQLATQYPAADNGSVHTQQYYLNLLSVNSSDDALPSSGNVTGPVTSRFQGRFDYIRGGNSNSSFSSSQANAWQHYDRSAFQNRPGFQDSRPPSPWVNRGYPFWNVFNTSTEIPSTSTSFVPFRILEEHINGKRFTTSASTTFTYYNQAATNIFASSAYSITRSEPAITNSVSASQRQTATPMTTVKTVIPPLHEESNSTFSTETTDSQIANSVAHPSQEIPRATAVPVISSISPSFPWTTSHALKAMYENKSQNSMGNELTPESTAAATFATGSIQITQDDASLAARNMAQMTFIVVAIAIPVCVLMIVSFLALLWVGVLRAKWKRHRQVDVEMQAPPPNGSFRTSASGTSSPKPFEGNRTHTSNHAWRSNSRCSTAPLA